MESQSTQGMDKLSLLEALSRANAADSWVTPWNDPERVSEYWNMLNDDKIESRINATIAAPWEDLDKIKEDAAAHKNDSTFINSNVFHGAIWIWPLQWRSGVYLDEGGSPFREIYDKTRSYTFNQLLDLLFNEVLEVGCLRWKLKDALDLDLDDPGIILGKTQWVALVPQEDVEGMGRGIGLYADPPETQDMYIPWQWWRPFLQRLKDRLCQGRISTESPRVFDFNYRKRFFHVVDPEDYKGRYLDMELSLRIEIGRTATSHEDHCVIRFVNAVERAG